MNSISMKLIVGGFAVGLFALSSMGSGFAASPKVHHTQTQDSQAMALYPANDAFGTPASMGSVKSRIQVPTANGLQWVNTDETDRVR
jgi:hypothetical protein